MVLCSQICFGKKIKKVVQLGQVVKPVCVSEKLTFKFEKVIKKKKTQPH